MGGEQFCIVFSSKNDTHLLKKKLVMIVDLVSVTSVSRLQVCVSALCDIF